MERRRRRCLESPGKMRVVIKSALLLLLLPLMHREERMKRALLLDLPNEIELNFGDWNMMSR